MKKIKILILTATLIFSFSCSKDDDETNSSKTIQVEYKISSDSPTAECDGYYTNENGENTSSISPAYESSLLPWSVTFNKKVKLGDDLFLVASITEEDASFTLEILIDGLVVSTRTYKDGSSTGATVYTF